MSTAGIRRFFDYAHMRHDVYLNRRNGMQRPWTNDPILQRYRFTNVFRELDKTTEWFRRHVRDPLRDRPEVLLATVVFRMLNRIETGEAIFCQLGLSGRTAFRAFTDSGDTSILRSAIRTYVGKRGPYVTGAYIISSPSGYSKLDGVLKIIGDFNKSSGWQQSRNVWLATDGGTSLRLMWECGTSLRLMWEWLRQQPYFGKFHSYEIVTDLRHTALLEHATDIDTWANAGPGARRGANRVAGRELSAKESEIEILHEMRDLLEMSRDAMYWPQGGKRTAQQARNELDWPRWELRDVEHTLCEFDKYERVRLGEGRPRGVYR